ncbi:MAG TPA: diguanylate cyclase [Myxococcota bacterium]|nr:diguanylate cyclase [Myxococcota bacterium]
MRSTVKKNTRDVAAGGAGSAGATGVGTAYDFDGSFDARSGFDDVRFALSGQLDRELDTLLLARASLDRLLNALLVRAPQRRTALGLAAFELDDWKASSSRVEPSAARAAFSQLARELRQRVRSSDELGRIGESSICIVLLGCEAHVLANVAERLRLGLDGKPLGAPTDGLHASLSVAVVSAYPRHGGPSAQALVAELCGALERRC